MAPRARAARAVHFEDRPKHCHCFNQQFAVLYQEIASEIVIHFYSSIFKLKVKVINNMSNVQEVEEKEKEKEKEEEEEDDRWVDVSTILCHRYS